MGWVMLSKKEFWNLEKITSLSNQPHIRYAKDILPEDVAASILMMFKEGLRFG